MEGYSEKLSRYNRNKINTEELRELFGIADYDVFHQVVTGLVDEGKLRPIKASRHNGRIPLCITGTGLSKSRMTRQYLWKRSAF